MGAKNVGKNSFFSVFSQLLIIVVGFFSQRVINLRLGAELVGLNGVISNVIMIFAVSELGISTAIVYHLYQALAEKNERKIADLMNLYRRAYTTVAGIIAALGICFMPFVHLLMKENPFSTAYIRLIYGLWLARTVFSYLLSYKRSMIIADQREYVSSLATLAVSVFNYLSVIIIVLLTNNYVLALGLGIAFEILVNICLIQYVNRNYPFLKKYRSEPVDRTLTGKVFGDVKNLFLTRISQKLLGSTDNLIMSAFINLTIVGFYSNYCLITQSLINIMQALSNALQPTIGNLAVEKNKERDRSLLESFTFLFFLLSAVILCGIAGMANLFVSEIWLDESYTLSEFSVFFCGVNCILYIMVLPIGVFLNVNGLFKQEKWVSAAAAAVNLILSLALVGPFGIEGVLTGTLVAYLIMMVGKSHYYFRNCLGTSMTGYVMTMMLYLCLAVGEAFATVKLVGMLYQKGNLLTFMLSICVCGIIPLACNAVLFCKSRVLKNTITVLNNYRNKTKNLQGEKA